MQFPNRLQSVLLFDAPIDVLEKAVRDFARIEEMKSGATFNVPETNPGVFYRLYNGSEELMMTFEYIAAPTNPDVFRASLSSMITGILTPDIRDRIAKTRSHIIIEVSHGVLGGVEENPQIAEMLESLGQAPAGNTQEQFHRRIDILTLASRIITDHAEPLAVHWTQSDMLLDFAKFETLAEIGTPGPLHIHPYLFGPQPQPGEPSTVGIRTHGARHWLGREIVVQPHILPWAASFECILAFLRIATAPNGYVIPDGDTFGPDDRSTSVRVDYVEPGEDNDLDDDGGPVYQLTPLKHTGYDFLDPDYAPEENVVDDRNFVGVPSDMDQDEKMEAANQWRESRKLAEAIGGSFEVRSKTKLDEPESPQPPVPPPAKVVEPTPSQPGMPTMSGRGLRAKVFGRKPA